MAVEQTLSIIKPDGVQKNLIGEIYKRFEDAGLEIIAAKMKHLTDKEAQGFYAVHRERPFFNDLVAYMTSGPVMIRAEFAASIEENVVHGSDGSDTAAAEIAFFFGEEGVCPRTRQD